MRVLFVCNQGENRSKTAADLFSRVWTTRSAGLFNERPLRGEDLAWADLVVVMDEVQRKEIAQRFPGLYLQKRIVNADVPDIYGRGQDELVEELRKRMSGLV